MNPRRMILSSALCAVLAGATAIDAGAATLKLTKSDNSDATTSFETWNVAGGGTAAPDAANDYLVSGGYYIRAAGSAKSFAGKSIAFGEVGGTAGMLVVKIANGSSFNFANEGATLANGLFKFWTTGRSVTLGGTVGGAASGPLVVTSPESAPFRISLGEVTSSVNNQNNALTISAEIKGAAGTALRLCSPETPKADSFMLSGTKSGFKGKLVVSGGAAGTGTDSAPVCAVLSGGALGGTLVVEKDAQAKTLYTSTKFSTAGLELKSGAVLVAKNARGSDACGRFDVTQSLVVEKGAVVRLLEHPYTSGADARSWTILTYPADKGTIPLENFAFADENEALPCTLSTNLVDGVWQLVASKPAHHLLAVNDDTSTTVANALPSALTNATSWADSLAPRGGDLYYAFNGVGGLEQYPVVRTPYQTEPFVFAGKALVLGTGGRLFPCGDDIAFENLYLNGNTTIALSLAKAVSHLRGRVFVRSAANDAYPATLQAYAYGTSFVEASLAGSGVLRVSGRSGSSRPYGSLEFTADNSAFSGKIKVCANLSSPAPSAAENEHERIFVAAANNLGGPLDAFVPDALELADYSVLEARGDVTLDVANRGIAITGNAGMAAPEGATLAVANPVSFSDGAVLRKTGAGVLALGGGLIRAGAASIVVQEGFLAALSATAFDGAVVSFSEGAYLLVDASAADPDLAARGAVDLADDPFGGALPVAFKLPDNYGESGEALHGIAVATVKDAATAGALVLSAKKIRGYAADFSVRANADGTATILASISRPAMVMVVR